MEALNNLLKTNQLKSNAWVTIGKLLDRIEEVVDIKMWKRITDMERSNVTKYQNRIIVKAHKKAGKVKNKVKVIVNTELESFRRCLAKALGENSVINSQNEKEIAQFIEEKRTQQISEKLEDQDKTEVKWTNFKN
ncbi:hypothetical protein JTB14_009419 [Gonioctena quinquepunctata]|nr:hypothetical protein JTB14_009419 [Gonioctena quinquepunctata]